MAGVFVCLTSWDAICFETVKKKKAVRKSVKQSRSGNIAVIVWNNEKSQGLTCCLVLVGTAPVSAVYQTKPNKGQEPGLEKVTTTLDSKMAGAEYTARLDILRHFDGVMINTCASHGSPEAGST